MRVLVSLVLAALVTVASAQCTYQNSSLSVRTGVANTPNISCAAVAGQWLAPLYANAPMIRVTNGASFAVAVFNSANYATYINGTASTCLNGANCSVALSDSYNFPQQWTYADTFYFVPVCRTASGCIFEVLIRMDSPSSNSTETLPPTSAPPPTSPPPTTPPPPPPSTFPPQTRQPGCSYEFAAFTVRPSPASQPFIACSAFPGQWIAPLYAGRSMIKIVGGGSFRVAIFNNTNYFRYDNGLSAVCANGINCSINNTNTFDTPFAIPYVDTFFFVPICLQPPAGAPNCTFEIYLRMDSPTPVSFETPAPTKKSGAVTAAPLIALAVALLLALFAM